MKSLGLISGLILLWGSVSAQDQLNDTVRIDEVRIVSSRLEYLTNDMRKEKIEKKDLKRFPNNSVAEILQTLTPLNIKSHGSAGASATLSIRGAGSNHTQVNWNGFPINSVTLGSSDLSSIPAGHFDNVSLVYGASGTLFGSGTFGGALNLGTDPRLTTKGFNGALNLEAGSLNSFGGGLNLSYANEKMAYSGVLWGKMSDGNFKYYDYIARKDKKRNNADWYNHGTIQQLGWALNPTTYIDGGVWMQAKRLNLPSIIGSQEPYEEMQKDSTLKTFVRLRKRFKRSALAVKSALFFDDTHYTKRLSKGDDYSINSRIKSKRWYADVNYRNYITDWMSWDVAGTFTWINADVTAYGTDKNEYDWALINALKFYKDRWSGQVSMRKEWNTAFNSDWLLGGNVGYQFIPQRLKAVAAFSQKFRKPTFNDRYWIPGGNKDLKPEDGNSWELNIEANLIEEKNIKWKALLSGYKSSIENMIVWRPQGAVWSPENYMEVDNQGIDLSTQAQFKFRKIDWSSQFSILVNDSKVKNTEENQKMFYAPKFSWSWNNSIQYNGFLLGIQNSYTASRYYDNKEKLDDFALMHVWVEKGLTVGQLNVVVKGKVSNILNKEYELVRSYPMPGRQWEMNVAIRF
ncbi:TonB-dependent receptor [Prolixibacteraceae bacterium JC049]|nr:TonB-dependent receptor [Prolixibacteraceae bacterium JC049]